VAYAAIAVMSSAFDFATLMRQSARSPLRG
jgi:hypothetical protein